MKVMTKKLSLALLVLAALGATQRCSAMDGAAVANAAEDLFQANQKNLADNVAAFLTYATEMGTAYEGACFQEARSSALKLSAEALTVSNDEDIARVSATLANLQKLLKKEVAKAVRQQSKL